jgi:hypothetical protein
MPTAEEMAKQYDSALSSTITELGPNATPEQIKAKFNDKLHTGLSVLKAFGDNPAFEKAYEQGIAAALQQKDPKVASQTFANTILSSYNMQMGRDPATGAVTLGNPTIAGGEITIDRTVAGMTFGIRHDNNEVANINTVAETYDKLSAMEDRLYKTQKPMVFTKPEDGTMWVAGVSGNLFTVQQVTPEAVALLDEAMKKPDQAAAMDELYKKVQGDPKLSSLHLMIGSYGRYYNLEGLRNEISYAKPFPDMKDIIDTRVTNYRGQARADVWNKGADEGRMRRNDALFGATGDPNIPGVRRNQPGAGNGPGTGRPGPSENGGPSQFEQMQKSNSAVGEEVYKRIGTLSAPVVLTEDYASRGRVRILYLDDRNGLADMQRQYGGNIQRALTHDEFFGIADITQDYSKFMGKYQAYCRENAQLMPGWGDEDKMKRFVQEYKFAGGNLETDFKQLAAIAALPAYRKNGLDVAGVAWYLQRRLSGSDDAAFVAGGGPVEDGGSSRGQKPHTQRPSAFSGHSWNPLANLFHRQARHRAGYPDEEPSNKAGNGSWAPERPTMPGESAASDGRSGGSALDPRRPIAKAPGDPNYVDPAPTAGTAFPGAAASQTGGPKPSESELFRDNTPSITNPTITPERQNPDDMFPGARSAPPNAIPGSRPGT